jgi:ATP-dependent Clp protease protease subunit
VNYPPPAILRSVGVGHTLSSAVTDHLLASRIVVLGGEVDDETANRLTAHLLLLAAEDDSADISFYVSSPGGSMTAAMAVHDTMRYVRPDVATWGLGSVAGMGQFLLSSGARGKRYALPTTRVLMHQPTASVSGTTSDVVAEAELLVRWKHQIAELTAEQTGQSVERVTSDADRDRWFTAEEAREYGFVDEVVSPTSPTRAD